MTRILLVLMLAFSLTAGLVACDPTTPGVEPCPDGEQAQFSLFATPAAVNLGRPGGTVAEYNAQVDIVVINQGAGDAWLSSVVVDAGSGFTLVTPFEPMELLSGESVMVGVVARPAEVVVPGVLTIVAEAQGCGSGVEVVSDTLTIPLASAQVVACDADNDGARSPACGGRDCDDSNPDVRPNVFDGCDGVDDDCDMLIDDDEPALAWYPDVDGDGAGQQHATAVFGCSQPAGLVANHDDCADDDASTQVCACAIDGPEFFFVGQDDFDDGDATVSGILGRATVLADLDGDGCSELVVGDGGTVWVFAGPVFGELSTEDAVAVITVEQPSFGTLMTMGDLTGDGSDDLVVSAPNESMVWVFSGTLSGQLDGSDAFATFTSQTPNALLGRSVAVGDWDGDGTEDLIIGEPSTIEGEGAVWVLYGPVVGSNVVQDRADGVIRGASAGSSVALVGDVTGDGLTDLVVGGVPPLDLGATVDDINLRGEIGIYSGPIRGEHVHPTDAVQTFESTDFGPSSPTASAAGYSVVGLADMNGDGRPDFAASAPETAVRPFWSLGTFRHGALGVFHGRSGSEPLYPPAYRLGLTEGGIGQVLASAGDVNGDGRTDLLVSSTSHDSCGSSGGSAALILGSIDVSSRLDVDWSRVSTRGAERVGTALASGDTNADGFSDIAITAPGSLLTRLYYGAPDAPAPPQPTFNAFRSCIAEPTGASVDARALVVGTVVDPATVSADQLRPELCPDEPMLLAAVENEDGLIWGWYGSRALPNADLVEGSSLSIGRVPEYRLSLECGQGWSTAVADERGLVFAEMRGTNTYEWELNPLSDALQVYSYCASRGNTGSSYSTHQISVDHQVVRRSGRTWIDTPGGEAQVSGRVVVDGGTHSCGWVTFTLVRG
jgi:hypothetical protein